MDFHNSKKILKSVGTVWDIDEILIDLEKSASLPNFTLEDYSYFTKKLGCCVSIFIKTIFRLGNEFMTTEFVKDLKTKENYI